MKVPEQLEFIVNGRATQKRSEASMEGKTCLVTGANSGIGFQAAKHLAKGGAKVVLVCRNPARAKAAQEELQVFATKPIELLIADFSKMDEVRRAAAEALERFPQIHVLVNNAGLHSTSRTLTDDGYETVFAVNHLSAFLFTRLLLERMKESGPARIIQVNSQGHRFNGLNIDDWNWEKRFYTGLRSYGQSKTAQLMTVWELADQLKDSGVTINAMHPGNVHSNVGSNNGFLYRWFKKLFIDLTLNDPDLSGQAIYWLAADAEMDGVSGQFYNLTVKETPASHALNREKGKKVWELSEKLTGLSSSSAA